MMISNLHQKKTCTGLGYWVTEINISFETKTFPLHFFPQRLHKQAQIHEALPSSPQRQD